MEDFGTGAGLAALGFWSFVAAAVIGSMWDKIRKREAQHETLRRVIESGQPIDELMINKLLSLTTGSKDLARDLKVSAYIMAGLVPGLIALGWGLSYLTEELLAIMFGVSALVGCIGVGLYAAGIALERQNPNDSSLS